MTTSSMTVTAEARRQANLRLLQRTCGPTIVDIAVQATHVVLYEYKHQQSWHKTSQEGSLFVVVHQTTNNNNNTNDNNKHELILLNRHSTDNFRMDVTAQLQVQHQEPYLIFKHQDKIYGIWFHSAEERAAVYDRLQTPVSPATTTATNTNTETTTIAPVAETTDSISNLLLSTSTKLAEETSSSDDTSPHVALDKKSLQLALLSLIQDDRFLHLLHQQYLRVIRTKQQKQNQQNQQNQHPPSGETS